MAGNSSPLEPILWNDPRLVNFGYSDKGHINHSIVANPASRSRSGEAEPKTVAPDDLPPVGVEHRHHLLNCSSSFQNLAARVSLYLSLNNKESALQVVNNCLRAREYQKKSKKRQVQAAYKTVEKARSLVASIPEKEVTRTKLLYTLSENGFYYIFKLYVEPEQIIQERVPQGQQKKNKALAAAAAEPEVSDSASQSTIVTKRAKLISGNSAYEGGKTRRKNGKKRRQTRKRT